MRPIILSTFLVLLTALPAHAGNTWRGDVMADASWNEDTRLQGVVHYPRPTDVFPQKGPYWRADADLFDHTDYRQAPRADLFPRKYRAKPGAKLFNDKF